MKIKIIKILMMFLVNSSLLAYINANTDFGGLPKDLVNLYNQLMVLDISPPHSRCTTLPISPNQAITAYHCVYPLRVKNNQYYNSYKFIRFLSHLLIKKYTNELEYFKSRFILNQDFTIFSGLDIDINPDLIPVFFNKQPEDIALLTINDTNRLNTFTDYINKDKIVINKETYCSYFDKDCKNIKPGYHLYFFGIRRSTQKDRLYLPKGAKISSYIAEWIDLPLLTWDMASVFNIFESSTLTLTVSHIEAESGDSGGPVFICNYNVNMKEENECRLIAVLSSDNILYTFLTPIFALKNLEEKKVKQTPPVFFLINTCKEFNDRYNADEYVYFFLDNRYYRFGKSYNPMYDSDSLKLITYDKGKQKNTGLNFRECENNKLYFSSIEKGAMFTQLNKSFFYKNTTTSMPPSKFYKCSDFEDFIKDKESVLFYTFYASINNENDFILSFYKFSKVDKRILVFNGLKLRWEKSEDDLKFIKCFKNIDNLAYLQFIDKIGKVKLILLGTILVYEY